MFFFQLLTFQIALTANILSIIHGFGVHAVFFLMHIKINRTVNFPQGSCAYHLKLVPFALPLRTSGLSGGSPGLCDAMVSGTPSFSLCKWRLSFAEAPSLCWEGEQDLCVSRMLKTDSERNDKVNANCSQLLYRFVPVRK